MNRIVLIGNGFDLAHGLRTSYKDFLNWYWERLKLSMVGNTTKELGDSYCSVKLKGDGIWNFVWFSNQMTFSGMSGKDHESLETKNWVDIEEDYYSLLVEYAFSSCYKGVYDNSKVKNLNEELDYLRGKLAEYLKTQHIEKSNVNEDIKLFITMRVERGEIAVESSERVRNYLADRASTRVAYPVSPFLVGFKNTDQRKWGFKLLNSVLNPTLFLYKLEDFKNNPHSEKKITTDFLLPKKILFVNFNYTDTVSYYLKDDLSEEIHIHGDLSNPEGMIFGYGDEIDEDYKKLQNLNDNECLMNMKSINYLQSDKYKKVLRFLESDLFQVYIMGHSCGISDRTLLNTIFEHKNCISVKPFFYINKEGKDNYTDIIQNISRNFTDMKLMRDRVVDKTKCMSLPQNQRPSVTSSVHIIP